MLLLLCNNATVPIRNSHRYYARVRTAFFLQFFFYHFYIKLIFFIRSTLTGWRRKLPISHWTNVHTYCRVINAIQLPTVRRSPLRRCNVFDTSAHGPFPVCLAIIVTECNSRCVAPPSLFSPPPSPAASGWFGFWPSSFVLSSFTTRWITIQSLPSLVRAAVRWCDIRQFRVLRVSRNRFTSGLCCCWHWFVWNFEKRIARHPPWTD